MDVHKIILPTPYPVGDVNTFLVKGDALTLFDAGTKTEEAYEALKWGVRAAGYELRDIEQVVLTHHHPDHAGWVDAFPKADILGHAYVDHWLRKEPSFLEYYQLFYKEQLGLQGVPDQYIEKITQVPGEIELFGTLPLTRFLVEGETVPGHENLRVYETPGHAQSHLIFVDEKTKQCIGGDLLLERVSSNPLVEPPIDLTKERPRSLLQYNHSLQRLHDLQVHTIYGGHGNEVQNANELIPERLAKQHDRAMKVHSMIDQPKNVYELTKELFQKVFEKQPGLTISETLGQLDYLVDKEYVIEQLQDGVIYYEKA